MGRKQRQSKGTNLSKIKVKRNALIEELLKKCAASSSGTIQSDFEEYMSIYNLIQEIRSLERKFIAPKREEHWPRFKKWCKDNGCTLDKVDIVSSESGEYGLSAIQTIEENELFLTIPSKIVLSIALSKRGTLAKLVDVDPLLKNMPNVVLALQLLVEREMPSSFWKPYIDILPSVYSTVFYFEPQELKLLGGSVVFEEALKLYKNIARQYAYLYMLFQRTDHFLKDSFTYDNYRWAVSTVMTRQNAVPSKNGNHSPLLALVPLWDMCNHSKGKVTTEFNLEKDQLECRAMHPASPGQEVFIFYGVRTNREFFLHNGFTYAENVNDTFPFKLEISWDDELSNLRDQLASKLSLVRSPFIYTVAPDNLDPDLLALLCIKEMSKGDLEKILSEDHPSLDSLKLELSNPYVQSGLSFLVTQLTSLQREYKEDTCSLEDPNPRQLMALQLITLEKEMLTKTLDYISANLKLLSTP